MDLDKFKSFLKNNWGTILAVTFFLFMAASVCSCNKETIPLGKYSTELTKTEDNCAPGFWEEEIKTHSFLIYMRGKEYVLEIQTDEEDVGHLIASSTNGRSFSTKMPGPQPLPDCTFIYQFDFNFLYPENRITGFNANIETLACANETSTCQRVWAITGNIMEKF